MTLKDFLPPITHWFWLGVSIFLAIHEILLGASFLFLWLGSAALLVFFVVWFFPEISWQYQCLGFGLTALLSIGLWRYFLKRWTRRVTAHAAPGLNRRGEQCVGRQFVLTEPIQQGYGTLQVDDVFWRIQGTDLPAGTLVRVIERTGMCLKVEKV